MNIQVKYQPEKVVKNILENYSQENLQFNPQQLILNMKVNWIVDTILLTVMIWPAIIVMMTMTVDS